jgi:hypothetical protein
MRECFQNAAAIFQTLSLCRFASLLAAAAPFFLAPAVSSFDIAQIMR